FVYMFVAFFSFFFFQAEDGIRDDLVTGVQTCALPICVRLAKERHPALVLTDIQLPGINGITALGQLRADPTTRAIPVIAVTASEIGRASCRERGEDGRRGERVRHERQETRRL